MQTTTANQIARLQKNLSILRKVAGWSAEDLSDYLDVTRQTIVNLESGQTRMTKIQYMAIRLVFTTEIETTHNEALQILMETLVDQNAFSKKEHEQIIHTIDVATHHVGRRAGSKAASVAAVAALQRSGLLVGLSAVTVATVTTLATSATWIHDILNKE